MSAMSSLVNHLVARFYIKDPNIKNVLDIQLPTLATQWEMARNEICYLLKTRRISNLNTVDFELTTRCNLTCGVCPVNTGLLKKERRGSMELDLFKKIIDRNTYLRRIRFTLWGEPLLHEDIFEFIDYARRHTKAYLLLYTNGTLLTPELSARLLDSGLDMIVFSIDGAGETYEKNRGFNYDDLKARIRGFMEEKQRRKSPMVTHVLAVGTPDVEAQMDAFMQEWESLGMDSVSVVSYSPFAEQCATNLKNPCRFFWRGYLAVNWNGDVCPCCTDYNARLSLGNVKDHDYDLGRFINSGKMQALRTTHINGKFPPPCDTCYEYHSERIARRFTL